MILYINTKDQKVIKVSLKENKRVASNKLVESLSEENKYGSQVLLPLISKLLDRKKMKYNDLDGIEVETGPGSFTGIRVGVSVANALGFALGIPVNDKQQEINLNYQ